MSLCDCLVSKEASVEERHAQAGERARERETISNFRSVASQHSARAGHQC